MKYIKFIQKGEKMVRRFPENYVDGDLDFCKDQFSYQSYDVRLYEVRNCLLTARGFVYENRFSLVEESLVVPDSVKGNELKGLNKKTFQFLKKFILKKKNLDLKKKYLIAFDDWSSSHYHWVCECMCRLFSVKDILPDYIIILPDTNYVKRVGLKFLDLLDLQPKDIVFIKEEEMFYADYVSIVTRPCHTGYINDPLIKKMQATIFEKIGNKKDDSLSRLYVSRERASYRKILNETQLLPLIKEYGFEIIHFEDFSFEEQVKLASRCGTLMSIHGAGLTNMIFMPQASSVIEFRRDKVYHNQCYWHLADALGHNYYYYFGQADSEQVIEGNGCNLTIDVNKFEKMLTVHFPSAS